MNARRLAGILGAAALTAALCAALPTHAGAGDWSGDANLFIGQKLLNGRDWEPVDQPQELGVEVSWGKKDWPIQIATDLLTTSEKKTELGVEHQGHTREFDFGFRKTWDKKAKLHLFFGGGMAALSGKIETSSPGTSVSDTAGAAGVWAGGGVFWRLGSHFNVGAESRLSKNLVKFSGENVETGGFHLGVLLGFHWPGAK